MRYLLRRVIHGLFVIVGVTVIVFFMLRLSGDPAALLLPQTATLEEIAEFRRAAGFDDPLPVQFLRFLGDAVQGNFGESFRQRQPAMEVVINRVPATLQLALTAQALALLLGFPLGTLAALNRNTFVDRSAIVVSTLGQAVPQFWLGLMMILIFSVVLGILPVSGSGGPEHLILPAVTLAVRPLGRITRLVRSSVLEVAEKEYVTTARAKGLRELDVVRRHILRNALIPVVTLAVLDLGYLMNGSVVMESVFAWPGVGRLITDSIYARDYAVVQAAVFLIAITYVVLNLLVDLLYPKLDPRVRIS